MSTDRSARPGSQADIHAIKLTAASPIPVFLESVIRINRGVSHRSLSFGWRRIKMRFHRLPHLPAAPTIGELKEGADEKNLGASVGFRCIRSAPRNACDISCECAVKGELVHPVWAFTLVSFVS